MIYDLDKIDSSRIDKLTKKIYMLIYDTKLDDINLEEHMNYMKKKVELYVNDIDSQVSSFTEGRVRVHI